MTNEIGVENNAHFITCTHPDYISANFMMDISELWIGVEHSKTVGDRKWGGRFTGRPGLANDMFEAIKSAALNMKPGAMRTLLSYLRSFWRFLD